MQRAEALLSDERAMAALSSDNLQVLVNAFNALGEHGPGISAAASRLGARVPQIHDGPMGAAAGAPA